MKATVIVVTLNRADCVRKCLTCFRLQSPRPDQIIVVDASADSLTRDVVSEFPEVEYLRNDNGYGRMTASRNIGLRAAFGDIIAFVDDDAFARLGWLQSLRNTFGDDPKVGAVGGRVLNNIAGEEFEGVDRVGRLLTNGTHTGFFAADTGRVVEVDHLMGCNMAFRREVLSQLGGFREDYPGISGVREDTDVSLRVGRLGYRVLFDPGAVVDHIGAPQASGRRFDSRYLYYSARNHVVLLVRNYGLTSSRLWRYVVTALGSCTWNLIRKCGRAFLAFMIIMGGTCAGLFSGIRLLLSTGRSPARHDRAGDEIRNSLARHSISPATANTLPSLLHHRSIIS